MQIGPADLLAVTKDLINKTTSYQFFPAKSEIFRHELLNRLTQYELLLEQMIKNDE
jgi:hypothetical protein